MIDSCTISLDVLKPIADEYYCQANNNNDAVIRKKKLLKKTGSKKREAKRS